MINKKHQEQIKKRPFLIGLIYFLAIKIHLTNFHLRLPQEGQEYRSASHFVISSEKANKATPPVTIATQIAKANPVPAKKYVTQAQKPPPTKLPPSIFKKNVLLASSL